jgi:hypothetical protein
MMSGRRTALMSPPSILAENGLYDDMTRVAKVVGARYFENQTILSIPLYFSSLKTTKSVLLDCQKYPVYDIFNPN